MQPQTRQNDCKKQRDRNKTSVRNREIKNRAYRTERLTFIDRENNQIYVQREKETYSLIDREREIYSLTDRERDIQSYRQRDGET